jgi:S1-C subfamily serine protease
MSRTPNGFPYIFLSLRAYIFCCIVLSFIFILFIMIPPNELAAAQFQPYMLPGEQRGTLSLGIIGVPITPDIARAMNLTQPGGQLVINVVEGSSADRANLRGGYTIANINGRDIEIGGDIIQQ